MNTGDFVMHWTLDPEGADIKAYVNDNSVMAYGRLVQVTFMHSGGNPPLVNLDNGRTSVPHQSYVKSATHGFYTEGPVVLGGKAEKA